MWKREEVVSSSDESLEEEVSPGGPGGFETAAGACKLKPVFDDIFADIQASIPTLDLEDSSEESNDSEEPVLYTRKAWPLSPDILAQTCLKNSEQVSSPFANASDSGLSLVSRDGRSSSSLSDSEQDSIELTDSSPAALPSTLEKMTVPTDTDLFSEASKSKGLSPSTLTQDVNNPDKVKLRFDLIEHLNLGDFLQRTNEVTVSPVFPPTLSDSDNSDSEGSGNSLMEELIRLSRKQQTDAAPEPNSPIYHPSPHTLESSVHKTHDVSVMSGPSAASMGVTALLDPSTQSRSNGTVFLDLRSLKEDTSSQTLPSSICRILGISNDSANLSSSSDEEEDLQHWQEQRRKAKEASLSCTRQKESHTKNSVVQYQNVVDQRKPANKEIFERFRPENVQPISDKRTGHVAVENEKKVPDIGTSQKSENVEINLPKTRAVLKDEKVHGAKQAWVDKSDLRDDKLRVGNAILDKKAPKNDLVHFEEQSLPPFTKSENKSTVGSKVSPSQRDDLRTINDIVRKDLSSSRTQELRKANVSHKQVLTEEEKAKRQRLLRSLQNLKPHRSSHGRHATAPSTPVLFHEEDSYESDVISLPDHDANTSYLLLSTKLSSCGELSVIRQGIRGATTPDTHCFSHLVAFLACLVAPSVNTTDYAEVCGAPFYVVGFQQSWHEGQLKIDTGICSRAEIGENQKKSKANNSFRQAVSKFLTTNSLHSVFARFSEFTPVPEYLTKIIASKRNLSTLLTVNSDPEAMHRVFGTKPGFFWQTMELDDYPTEEKTGSKICQGPEIQNTVTLLQQAVFHSPFCVVDVLMRARRKALDISGVRLTYHRECPKENSANESSLRISLLPEQTPVEMPVLVIALRGPQAISRWQDEVGPVDAKLAQRTDPNSLRALYSNGAKTDHLFWCPRNSQSAGTSLARWFGGRVPESGVINIGSNDPLEAYDKKNKVSPSGKGRNAAKAQELLTSSLYTTCRPPPHFLTSVIDTSIFFVLSPAVPVRYLGKVLCMCLEKGFSPQGIKRLRLNPNHLGGLGLAPEVLSAFRPRREKQSNGVLKTRSPVASTILLLKRENAIHHAISVVKPLADFIGLPQSSFLCVPYTDSMFKHLGGDFSHCPDPAAYPVDLLRHAFHSSPELEQVCVVTLLKEKATISAGEVLNELLLEREEVEATKETLSSISGFELLGLKLLSSLSMHQAKEFTPCKIGDALWKRSLQNLTSGPALVLALRGVDAFVRLQRFLESHSDLTKAKLSKDSISQEMLMSYTPELACRQLSVVFFDRELFSDQSARRSLHLLPPPRRVVSVSGSSGSSESLNDADGSRKQRNRRMRLSKLPLKASLGSVETLRYEDMPVLQSLLEKPRVIPTVCILKPGIASKHLGKVLKRLGQEGFSVAGMKMIILSSVEVSTLMANQDKDLQRHVSHMTSGPVVALCLQRENAVGRLQEVLGPGDARLAKRQSQFFLRGSFGEDSVRNAFYGSATYEEAIRDVKLLFAEGVCCPPSIDLKAEEIPCLALDDIFSVTAKRELVELTAEEQAKVDTGPGMTLLPSSLLEINCVLLLPQMLNCRAKQSSRRVASISYAEIIEALLTAGFHFIGLRLLLLGVAEAADCAKLYSGCLPAGWKAHHLAAQLSKTPCIVMAVLRDGAVTCYDTLCDSSPKLKKSGNYMLAGRTLKEAKRMTECFFEMLIPNRKARITWNLL